MEINWGSIAESSITYIIVSFIIGMIAILKRKRISLLFKKIKFKIQPRKYQVVFALEFNEGLNSGNYYQQIKKDFLKQIDNSGLSKQIKVLDISDIYLFVKIEDAEKFRRKHDLDLVVWGDFSNDKLKIDEELVNKIDLNFTFRIPQDLNQLKSIITLDLQSKFAQKCYWQIYEKNSLNDIEIISNNLFDIATYILALSLKIFGKLNECTKLFENLYDDLKRRNDNLSQQIIPHLLNCYDILSIEHGLHRKNNNLGITYCKKILKLDPHNFSALCNIAVFQFRIGQKDQAYKNIDKLKEYHPNRDITIVDVAFFRILEKDYSSALRGYKKLKQKHRNISFNVTEVVEFLDEQYKELKDPAYLFASGFLNCNYGDMESGKKDFNYFLKKANTNTHQVLIKEAKRLLTIDFK